MSESKKICCCTARTWSLVVASLSLVRSLLVGIDTIITLQDCEELERQGISVDAAYCEKLRTILSIIIAGIAVGLVMDSLLIFGVKRRSSGVILAWLCYAVAGTILNVGLSFADVLPPDNPITTVLVLCVYVILLFIVHTHWKEIRGSS